ncbi:ABC transporter ATP-binding protein [Anaerocolumna sp. MB42-C2]|uniref:ABC transporter ATP-binding protein n=1 Tax=Anaerocolumna sp. MB42-C2 TaxID=3070997 RepID=UPI0027E08242|nr:oligopeptide/dipeptide ABC transporter ATP-binding protein [Anaerocolumna sp. MB42-C2]WMJ88179.1 ATP-binding cassette domain-containing protein [Anaerocolumna sp. MB42-C2]
MTLNKREPILKVDGLCKYFSISSKETLKAVDNVSFEIYKQEVVGIVGESGCGKSTLGRCLLRLYEPTKGSIYYENTNLKDVKTRSQKKEFCKNVQMIFQNPYASLNPRMTVKEIVGEGMKLYQRYSPKDLDDKVIELLGKVGMNKDHMSRFSHEFSGGQKQRIGIARALSVGPKLIVCDEPISALDVSIQAQVINMLKKLREEMGLTYLFIAHDLSVVKYISDRVIVMYLGMIVEIGETEELYEHPAHPYTQAMLSAIPIADPNRSRNQKGIPIIGEVPSPVNPPETCRFAERCPKAQEIC